MFGKLEKPILTLLNFLFVSLLSGEGTLVAPNNIDDDRQNVKSQKRLIIIIIINNLMSYPPR